ncbi:MAG: DUF1847 domain-containing protein [Syntrophobacteraceae bacterium]
MPEEQEGKKLVSSCAKCPVQKCVFPGRKEPRPKFCPILLNHKEAKKAKEVLFSDQAVGTEDFKINMAAEFVLHQAFDDEFGPTLTRIEEVMEFARVMKWSRIGIACCIALVEEARQLDSILNQNGFETVSVMCMAAGGARHSDGLGWQTKFLQALPLCNPVMQAYVLNKEQTDFNLEFGLCVGHDILFRKYVEAPTTCLAIKDRVLGNNPLAGIYTANLYYFNRYLPQAHVFGKKGEEMFARR